MYDVMIACSVPAFARVEVEADSESELVEKIRAILDQDAADLSFDELEWGSADDYRLANVRQDGKHVELTNAQWDEIEAA